MIADGISDVREDDPRYVYDRHAYRMKRSKNEIGIHSVRGGTIVGEHSVIFAGNDEVLTITHQAQSKALFATGAVSAAIFTMCSRRGLPPRQRPSVSSTRWPPIWIASIS